MLAPARVFQKTMTGLMMMTTMMMGWEWSALNEAKHVYMEKAALTGVVAGQAGRNDAVL